MLNYLSRKTKYIISQCSWKNVLNFETLLKLVFMYCISVVVIIFFQYDYSPGAFSNQSKPKIAIYSTVRLGEHQSYLKTIKALKKLDIDFVGCSYGEAYMNYFLTRHFYQAATYLLHKLVKPEFSISLTHHVSIFSPDYNLVYINVPDVLIFERDGKFNSSFKHLKDFDGYIDLFTFVNGKNPDLIEVLQKEGVKNPFITPAYLAQDISELKLPKSYNNAVITGTLWGCNRSSYRLISSLKKLGNEGLVKAYGMSYAYDFMEDSYLGPLEDFGTPIDAVINLQREGGISLVFHNFEHFIQGIPTSRIAEGIMSGAVIISDHHPFVLKHFRNNVLYFDSFAPSEQIYRQIKTHISWVKNNPERAREMARKNHEIFAQEFSLEAQLPRVIKAIENHLK